MRNLLSIFALGLYLVGCANPVNRYTAGKYADAAISAREAGNWRLARSNWARAITNAQIGGEANTRSMAIAYYEYGRSSGIICDWTEAERGLQKSLELDRRLNGPIHLSLIELGRMHFDQKQYEPARNYFSEAFKLFEAMNAETMDPLGYAQFLDEYSLSLESTGAADQAAPFRSRAQQLRTTFPAGKNRTDRTPYGTQCSAP